MITSTVWNYKRDSSLGRSSRDCEQNAVTVRSKSVYLYSLTQNLTMMLSYFI